MSEVTAKPRRRKFWKYLLLGLLVSLVSLGGLAWYVTTDAFQAMVRRRLIAELERVTGGRVELGSIHTIPFRFRVEIRDLTIHGGERSDEIPYVHVDRLLARVKIISALGARFGFDSLVLEHPVIHIIRYPDGSTNQPQPRLKPVSDKRAIEQLFSISVNRLEIRRGEALWNDQKIPIDCVVRDVSLDMRYFLLHRRYQGNLLLGKVDTRFDGYRPIAWMTETHFTLSRDRLDITSLKATSGRSRVEASGRVEDFDHPRITATYDVNVDLVEAAAIVRRPEARGGVLQLTGQGSWSVKEFSSRGQLLLKDLDWRNEAVNLRNGSLSAKFEVSPQRITLSQIQAKLLGGVVSGEVDVTNWLNSGARSGRKPDRQGTARLAFKSLSAGEVTAALSTRARPFDRLNVVGLVSGTIQARWKGAPRKAEAEIALDVAAPQQAAPHQLPLNLHFRGSYRGAAEELEVSDLTASTRATQLHASGLLSSSAAVRFSLSSTDLQEWQPVLAAFGNGHRIPVVLHGRAVFMGTATGKPADVTIAGNLRAEDFDTVLPASSQRAERRVHWDVLDSHLRLSPHSFTAHDGTLSRGNAVVRFDLNAGLHQGEFTASSGFTARVAVRNAEVGEILSLAGYQYPISGTMNLHVEAGGTRAEPHGTGRLELTKAVIYGEPVEHFLSDLRFTDGELQLNNIQMAYYDAHVSGAAGFNPSSRALRFNLAGTNFDLTRIPQLQTGRMTVAGRMDFTAQGSGTPDEPAVNAVLQLHDLTLNQERAGDFTIEAVTRGADLHLTGRSQFPQAELTVDGDVRLRDDWPARATLRFNHLDVDPLLQSYLKGRITGHSAVAGEVHVEGPLRRRQDLIITANLSDFFADVQNIKVRNDGPIRFSIADQVLKVDQFRLVGEGTDLSASGSLGLVGERKINAHAQGALNLKLLESYNPDLAASGMVTVDMTASGTVAQPIIQGRLQVANGALAHADLPSGLSDVNGTLVFNQNRLQIETLTAHTGGGSVKFGGYATYGRQLNFDLTVRGQDVRLRYPPGISSTANADLHFAGNSTASLLSGDITITKLAMTPGFDFGSYLARSAQSSTLPQTNPLLNRIRLDVHVVTTPELQMRTSVARLSGNADLHLRGTAAKPALLGRADVIEGEVYFNGAKYRLEHGDVSFLSPVTIKPVLDLQMTTRVRDYDITVNLNGEPSRLNLTYRSEPPLPEADIVALLALGRTREESAQLQQSGQSPFSQEASNAILSEALNATVSNRVQRLFGVSRIKIDPQGLSTETNPARGPQVTIEQQVAGNLTLTYSQNVSQAAQQIIQVEYNVSRNVSIVAIRDQNGVVSFDVRIRQRKK